MTIQIVALVDESWSMNKKRSAVIEGINSFIDEQLKLGEDAEFTLIYFNHTYKMVNYRIPLKEAKYLTTDTYVPAGDTALLDAIGKTLSQFKHLKESHPDSVNNVIIAIMTDGEENSSKEFNNAKVKELTKEAEESFKWQINYLAANQDAFAVASAMGISNAYNFADTASGVKGGIRAMSASSSMYRAAAAAAAPESESIDLSYYVSNKSDWEQIIDKAKTEGIK